jgi:serine/threonine protein kinase
MGEPLRANDEDLRDLAEGCPALRDAQGRPTGLTLRRCLGVGGMSVVFLADADPAHFPERPPGGRPSQLAVKITRPATARHLVGLGLDPLSIAVREATALGRIMARNPPTPFVIGLHGGGATRILLRDGPEITLPWLALEYVDGAGEGASLTERVRRATEGVDPARALRLTAGILEGARVLHEEGIVHRDLKPDNVLLAGPVDHETPRIADCGIARVQGLDGKTLAAMTPAYGGPEQVLSVFRPGERNPLVGPWTDVHALSAVVWFLLTGEDWCRGESDAAWHGGQRRSLLTAQRRLHPGFAAHTELIAGLDRVLQRGASHRLPEQVWTNPGGAEYEQLARIRFAGSMFSGPERFLDVQALSRELLPLLSELAGRQQSGHADPLRSTRLLPALRVDAAPWPFSEEPPPEEALRVAPGCALLQPDGRALVRSGDRLLYLIRRKAHRVAVPAAWREAVDASRWLVRAPGGGYALLGPRSAVRIVGGRYSPFPVPERPEGAVGKVVAVCSGKGALHLLTAGATGAEPCGLWSSRDGVAWEGPARLAFEGIPLVIGEGPGGVLALGHLPGSVLPPVALAFDPSGAPWALTAREVLRRREDDRWERVHRRDEGRPCLVALGFSAGGVLVLDERGGLLRMDAPDIDGWRAAASTSLLLAEEG